MEQNFWSKLQAVDRRILYAILVLAVVSGLYIKVDVPAKAADSSISFYNSFEKLDPEKPVLLQSDWTNSTRGESQGHLEAILKMLAYRRQKFVLYSLADPQAPQVARNVLRFVNLTLPEDKKLVLGRDYIDLGYFPNAEGTTQAMGVNLRSAWQGRKTKTPDRQEIDIFRSDVLKNVRRIEDVAAVVYITASATIDVGIQRLSGKVTLLCMCTGVVGPTLLPYYSSGQLSGVAIGLKGVYDVEMMMYYGINKRQADGKDPKIASTNVSGVIEPIDGYQHVGRGKTYYAALNVVLMLLIVAIVVGNVAMFASGQNKRKS